jgi:ATP-binding cassette subfamily F protein 3
VIQLANVHKSFGERTLFEDVSWQLQRRDRVGLTGPNGAGKTTLLRMLAGLDEPDKGQIIKPNNLTIGYLPQDGIDHSGRTLLEEASLAFEPLLNIKAELHELEHKLGDSSVSQEEHEAALSRYSEVQETFRAQDGYTIDLRVATVLRGLGFADEDHERPPARFPAVGRCGSRSPLLPRVPTAAARRADESSDPKRNWLEDTCTDPHAVIPVHRPLLRLGGQSHRGTAHADGLSAATAPTERDARLERRARRSGARTRKWPRQSIHRRFRK